MEGFAIVSRRVVLPRDGEADRLDVVPAAVLVEGHMITRVDRMQGSDPAEHAATWGVDVIDVGDKLVTPAFINAHTHVALVGLRGGVESQVARGNMVEDLFYDWEHHLTPEDVRAFSRVGAYECLLHGTGLVWDHYWHADALVAAFRDTGLGAIVGPALQDRSGPGVPWVEAQLDATRRLAQDPTLAADGIAIAVAPHATDTVSAKLWQECAHISHDFEIPIHAHCAQSLEELERRWAEDGCSPVGWLKRIGIIDEAARLLLVHMLYASEPDLGSLDPQRHFLGMCPYSQLQFGFPAPLLHWDSFGLRFVTATDAACSNDSMNVQKELRWAGGWRNAPVGASAEFNRFAEGGDIGAAREFWAARRERHTVGEALAHPHRLLASVWSDPGKLHPGLPCGVLASGTLANVLIWDTDHPSFWPATDPLRALAYGDTTPAIHAMWVAGKPIGTAGDFARSLVQSDEYREARKEAEERLAVLGK